MSKLRIVGILAVAGVVALGTGAVLKADIDFMQADTKVTLVNETTAIVTGTIRCAEDDTLNIFANVVQEQSGGTISQGSIDDVCTGQLQTFVITTTVAFPADGAFKKGPATVLVQAGTSDGVGGSDNQILTQKGHIGR